MDHAFAAPLGLPSQDFGSGELFPNRVNITGTTTEIFFEGLGVAASLSANRTWHMLFTAPPTIPLATTPKIEVFGYANATAGIARVNPKWRAVDPGANITDTALTAESITPTSKTGGGAGDTFEWNAGANQILLRRRWNMDGTTVPTAGQIIILELAFETAGWTLAAKGTFMPRIFWS